MFEEHLWEAAAAEVDMGIPRSSREVERLAEATAADVVGTLSDASPEDQAVFSADSVEGKVGWRAQGCLQPGSLQCYGLLAPFFPQCVRDQRTCTMPAPHKNKE